jgi:hypothetical protein
MAGATKLFATAIDIRDVAKWKAKRPVILGPKRSAFATPELRSVIAIDMRGRLMSCVTAPTISANELDALGEVFHAMNSTLDLKAVLPTIVSKAMRFLEHRHNRSRFHESKLRSLTGIIAFVSNQFRRTDIGLRRCQMSKFDSRRAIHKTIIIAAASLAVATATVTTAPSAFARGGGHFGGGGFGGHFGGGRFGRGFGYGGYGYGRYGYGYGGYGYGGYGYGGYGYGGYGGCYVFTPYGYTWACY